MSSNRSFSDPVHPGPSQSPPSQLLKTPGSSASRSPPPPSKPEVTNILFNRPKEQSESKDLTKDGIGSDSLSSGFYYSYRCFSLFFSCVLWVSFHPLDDFHSYVPFYMHIITSHTFFYVYITLFGAFVRCSYCWFKAIKG